jgi:fumarate reductase subunit D
MKRRSEEPLYWLLFGAGGVVAAILLPSMILISGILSPLGVMPDTLSYEKMHAFASSWIGALILLIAIVLPIYHAMHRIYHGLHDLGVHPTKFLHYLLYGFAFLVSVATLTLLIQIH